MLNMIKSMIKEQQAYLEAADLILEEDDELDDSITLSEEPDEPEDDDSSNFDNETPTNEELDEDELPDAVGAETGEPAQAGNDDILGMTIDLATNTSTDTLPVPPSNASDAIEDGDDHYVSSGFGGGDMMDEPADSETEQSDDEEEMLDEPVGESDDEDILDSDILSEAITVGDSSEPAPDDTSTSDQGAADNGNVMDEPVDQPEDNTVTSAVKDKVAELDATDDGSTGNNSVKDTLLKKLGNLTKSLEDAKKTIMDKISD